MEELKESIREGDTSFLNRVSYWNQHVYGSSAFWQKKRQEIYSWMNHHVEVGNGPPMLFITLSCAEHYWPDIIRLIKERLELAGQPSDQCYVGSPQLGKLLNENAVVVQEHFQIRV